MQKKIHNQKSNLYPDVRGYFGKFGGSFIPETLMPAILEVERSYKEARKDSTFQSELKYYLEHYVGRPSPLYFAKNMSEELGGAKIYFKRDELNHTGAHKINSCIGQALLAKRMKKTRIIAETGAGQHGVATATVAALFGLKCVIYMGEKDAERQSPNLFRMKLLGAEIIQVKTGSKTLKDAMNEAMRDWAMNVNDTYYLIGTVAGPHPYPWMVREFQSIIGVEARQQIIKAESRLPDVLVACVGGGSNAIGLFYPFLKDKKIKIFGVEAAGKGLKKGSAASINVGKPGILHGAHSYVMQNKYGQITETHSISAGLDYPGIGPEHAFLNDSGRVKYEVITDKEALKAFSFCSKIEGIIPALEPSHAIAYVMKIAPKMKKNSIIIANLCGRGDKDIFTVAQTLGVKI